MRVRRPSPQGCSTSFPYLGRGSPPRHGISVIVILKILSQHVEQLQPMAELLGD